MLQYEADKSRWHWLMWPLIDLFGFELVWSVGLETLGYPPTLVDLPAEAELVESALLKL